MKNINRMINKTIIEITLLIILCVISFSVFNHHKLNGVIDNVVYTEIDVIKNISMIGIDDFTSEAQVQLIVSNYSNTTEDYNILLTSQCDLKNIEDYLKIRIDNEEFFLKDLKVADNYFLIDRGSMKANAKEIDIYFAIDSININGLNTNIPFYFVNDLAI